MPFNLKYVDEGPPSPAQQVEDFYKKMLSDVSFYNNVDEKITKEFLDEYEKLLNEYDTKTLSMLPKGGKTPTIDDYPGPTCPCVHCKKKYRTGTTSTDDEKVKVNMVE